MNTNIIYKIDEIALSNVITGQKILDFHCENTEIIANIAKHICQTKNWQKAYEILCHVEGWVYDTTSIKNIENKLNHIVEKYHPNIAYTIPWQIYPYESVQKRIENKDYKIIISNITNINTKNIKYLEASVLSKYSIHKTQEYCYLSFIELGLNLLSETGQMILTIPHTFLNTKPAENMLRTLINNNLIEQIIDKDKYLILHIVKNREKPFWTYIHNNTPKYIPNGYYINDNI